MKPIKLFAVKKNNDQTEGRGPMVDVYYTEKQELALKIVNSEIFYRKYGVQGTPPYENGKHDVGPKDIVILENYEDFLKAEKNIKAQKALDKLTEEDKQILGLK
jgi:hypothetical protein